MNYFRIAFPLFIFFALTAFGHYAYGYGHDKYYSESTAKLKQQAANGDAKAQLSLGAYYYNKADYAKADYWYRKSADQGNAIAECWLGDAYYHGRGVPVNYSEAFYLWKESAMQNSHSGEEKLGFAYKYGIGVPINYSESNYWYKKSEKHAWDLGW